MHGGELIRIARRRAGITQAELAARFHTTQSTVARWESGGQEPAFSVVLGACRAAGFEAMVGLGTADDHDRVLAARQLTLPVAARVMRLCRAGFDPAAIAAALASCRVRYVLAGDVAAAVQGSPLLLGSETAFLIVPEDTPANLKRLDMAADRLGAGPPSVDEPYGSLDARTVWPLAGGGALARCERPAGAHGYRDLHRDAESVRLGAESVLVASLLDLIRLADASPRPEGRRAISALRDTLAVVHQQSGEAAA
jgi:transcriptional regulator with XRE-family HTH domain